MTELKWNSASWPKLDEGALYGLAGEIVRAIEEETEADRAALLATLLVAFGNAIGPQPHARVQDDQHPARFSMVIVGATSSGKGTSFSTIKPFLRAADGSWLTNCQKSGFGSGEAIIAELAGSHREGDVAIERRALIHEPEFARLLTVNNRESSTSSPILRSAWDDGRLELRHSKMRLVAHNAHVSILAHITPEELRAKLNTMEVASGFANRCLWVLVKRARKLPSGGNIGSEIIGEYGRRLSEAMRFARELSVICRTPKAESEWAKFYHAEPDRDGLVGAITARSQAQKLRLSVAYALLDSSSAIRSEHVIAAESFWRYSAASAQHIWAASLGDSVQDRLLDELRAAYPNGLSFTEQSGIFGRHVSEPRLRVARQALESRGLIETKAVKPEEGTGRPTSVSIALRSAK